MSLYYDDAEDYELFERFEELHPPNCRTDPDPYVVKTLWFGITDWKLLYPDVPGDSKPAAGTIEFSLPDSPRLTWGWMPPDEPYWHRASHCPYRKEDT